MGDSLYRYLRMKIHPLVNSSQWDKLVVMGVHNRTKGDAVVSSREKHDRPFNWMRPTAKLAGTELHIMCFPGAGHVEHYAALLATYLRITRSAEEAAKVSYIPVQSWETKAALTEQTNLLRMPKADVVVTGLVHRLPVLTKDGPFEGGPNDEFAWIIQRFGRSNKTVAFLGCRFSFWGSISGDLVRILAQHTRAEQFIYFGKLGTTIPSIPPNRYLASGCSSHVEGADVRWTNALDPLLRKHNEVPLIFGKHETLPSVLSETHDWLAQAKSNNHHFVDPEVGCMGLAAVECGVDFGYLHLISDNVAKKYDEDLSNERTSSVLRGRDELYSQVNYLLLEHLEAL